MKAFGGHLCSVLGLALCLMAAQGIATARAETCWQVFYVSTGESGETADEVICLTSQTEGYVRETSIFGSGAIGCNRVTVNRSGGAMDFVVDYSQCTNNSPSHSISCPSPEGDRFKCTWRMLEGDPQPSDAYLVREQ
jgi:hypothetical protein